MNVTNRLKCDFIFIFFSVKFACCCKMLSIQYRPQTASLGFGHEITSFTKTNVADSVLLS